MLGEGLLDTGEGRAVRTHGGCGMQHRLYTA